MATREQQLADWKEQKGARPAGGLANITNKGPAPAGPPAAKPTVTFAAEPEVVPDKENPRVEAAAPRAQAPPADPAPSSVRKPALDGSQREQMEQQFDMLQGRLHSIQRESRRPSISGVPAARPAAPAPEAAPYGGLAARLESLRRDSVRPSLAGTGVPAGQFEAAGQYDTQALSRLAQQMFGDAEFVALCERGMSAQLTRSKDGATEETKIKELAGGISDIHRATAPPIPTAHSCSPLTAHRPPPSAPLQAWSRSCAAA
jgi:hypothetical protein